jgi:outer membrane protein assembly factor BamE (lipoprotein component of BamABCDE complex)
MKVKHLLYLIVLMIFVSGCASASYQRQQVRDDTGDRLTVGKVQKEIRIGMSSADVIQTLGSPNVVTTDEERREVWVYDKIATEVVYSQSDSGLKFLTSGSSGAASKSQRTLTVVIKFDVDGKVRDFAYHTSSF